MPLAQTSTELILTLQVLGLYCMALRVNCDGETIIISHYDNRCVQTLCYRFYSALLCAAPVQLLIVPISNKPPGQAKTEVAHTAAPAGMGHSLTPAPPAPTTRTHHVQLEGCTIQTPPGAIGGAEGLGRSAPPSNCSVAPATRGSPAVHETKPVHQSSASRSPLTFSSGPPPAGHGRQRHLEAPYYTLYEITDAI